MKPMFKILKFEKEVNLPKSIIRSKWSFFIPGINSGIYSPATICANVSIEEVKAGFFKLRRSKTGANITFSPKEFDELYEEMTKIKKLRDNEILNKS